ncbi:MAG: hypothetical protein LBU58_12225 [Clostridiales bacterium]|nr:hypothetical protein [Clostridiales bacterium]
MSEVFFYKFIRLLRPTRRRAVGAAAAVLREDGAAMVMVLAIIFMMSTLGGIALLATLGNVKMSVKYADWTREYYALDRAAEAQLKKLDALLISAEGYAYAYMRSEGFRENEAIPRITGDSATELNAKAQNYIYNSWYNNVYTPSLTDGQRVDGLRLLDDDLYNSLFPRFNDEFFKRLYYYYAYRLISREARAGEFAGVELSPAMIGFAGMLDGYTADRNGMKVGIDVSDGQTAYPKHVSVNVYVASPQFGLETQAEDVPFRANPIWTNALLARGTVTFAGAAAAPGSESGSVPAPGSGPDFIPAPGSESGSAPGSSPDLAPAPGSAPVVRVYGDVSAQDYNEYHADLKDYASPEGNENGVVSAGAVVGIFGNVYTRGDVHVTASGGALSVRRYPEGFDTRYKQNAYGNSLFFDTSVAPAMMQRYTQAEDGAWDREFIPFFYRDHLGGNVYCNNLSIEENVNEAAITIENGPVEEGENAGLTGVVWTLDDVQNDGHNSEISLAGNLVGISSDAMFSDHTSSSAVVNTHYENSKIRLSGALIAPGSAFIQFDGVNDLMDEDTYFETAESVSATNNAILRAYMEKPNFTPSSLYYYDRFALNTERGMSDFFLVNYETLSEKVRHLVGNLSGNIPDTGIVTPETVEGYARGAVISADAGGTKRMYGTPGFEAIEGYQEIANYAQNYLAYSEIKDSLKAAFSAKTETLGTAGKRFADLVKPAALLDPTGALYPNLNGPVTYLTGGGVFDLTEDREGIVYCAAGRDGALPTLVIRGDGSFRGTIISEGDIVIEGSPTIRYDENLLAKIILFYPEIRDFFSPGEMGETSYVRIMSLAQSAVRLKQDRYTVANWTEWQE